MPTAFPHLKYPPFFADLDLDGSTHPELRIDGYLGDRLVLSRSFSSDHSADRLSLKLDDPELIGDGSDATRLVFQVTDKFGALRPIAHGEIAIQVHGPGVLVGDNPFQLEDTGGSGAVWIKAAPRGGREDHHRSPPFFAGQPNRHNRSPRRDAGLVSDSFRPNQNGSSRISSRDRSHSIRQIAKITMNSAY